jgi:hypothetical protein
MAACLGWAWWSLGRVSSTDAKNATLKDTARKVCPSHAEAVRRESPIAIMADQGAAATASAPFAVTAA